MSRRLSVAMTADVDAQLRQHLLRPDGQEDVCLGTYTTSTGRNRTTYLVRTVILPREGERLIHGNASFTGDYVLRGSIEAAAHDEGLVLLHSHPAGIGWQGMSAPDEATESGYSGSAKAITKMPVLGMTFGGGSLSWSARLWTSRSEHRAVESVRVVGEQLRVSWNTAIRPVPLVTAAQQRTVSAWGDGVQADLARLRVLVVGTGSVGLDVAQRIAASGVEETGVMDFDEVEVRNLDRMIGATRADARLGRAKVEVAGRLMRSQATARNPVIRMHEESLCTEAGLKAALDYDVIFSCVDRPWPRAILNTVAYADLVPVIDGGITIKVADNGRMQSATARAHTLVSGRPCMVCTRQIRTVQIRLDQQGLLDDEEYIKRAGLSPRTSGQNVGLLCATVSAMLLTQLVSLLAAPGGTGIPSPLCFHFRHHALEHLDDQPNPGCPWETDPGRGDRRIMLTDYRHKRAEEMIERRIRRRRTMRYRFKELMVRIGTRLDN